MKTILTVLGARPQFIKAATVSRIFRETAYFKEIVVHTGQHFDGNMSQVFFEELEIPKPDYHLGISGGGHGVMTGVMLEKLEPLLQDIQPDWVLVYGDTNSTLAGALASAKLFVPVAHVEAGLRSHNRRMPEEINRILADQLSMILFCPTEAAVNNLKKEGYPHQITKSKQFISKCGDVMYDAALFYGKKAERYSRVLAEHGLEHGKYVLATVHRQENTDDAGRLKSVFEGLQELTKDIPVVLPLHPRTRAAIKRENIDSRGIYIIEPVGYLDMVMLERGAAVITTDSGGVQKEAYFHGIPCVTLREETEWTELVESGWNRLASPGSADITQEIMKALYSKGNAIQPYGDGNAAKLIVESLHDFIEV
jgi:UDP-GlcNAc3NAcA epimerase